MRSIVPDNIRRHTLSSYSSAACGGQSEVEKTAALHKAMREQHDKEVSYYDNPTILSRLIQNQKFTAALERLEKKGAAEASIWVCTKRQTATATGEGGNSNSHGGGEGDGTSLISGMTSMITQISYKDEYTYRALPIHMACSNLGRTVDKGLWAELEKLIAYLAIVYPQGCSRRDHEGRMPLHEAIWYNASPNTVSALLMAAPQAINEQEYKHGRYPISLNEHRTGHHKETVRKLLKLRRKYWDMAREEATLRFKHRNVPSADESITSTSVLAASLCNDDETLFTTPSAFPLSYAMKGMTAAVPAETTSSSSPAANQRMLHKATNVNQTGREPIKPMSWSQLEKRCMLAEQKLEQVNEVNYILSKQVIEFRAAKKELQEKLNRYTKTDLGRQVKRLETEKDDLAWQVQRLYGLLLRNGIALDPDEATFINKSSSCSQSPPREVKVAATAAVAATAEEKEESPLLQNNVAVENGKVVNPPPSNENENNKKSSSSDTRQQQQQQQEEKSAESLNVDNEQYQTQLAAAAATTTTANKSSCVPHQRQLPTVAVAASAPAPTAAAAVTAAPYNSYANNSYEVVDDDDETDDHDGNSACISHYSFGTGSQQSALEYDMQVLEEMNERVRQLVISESASNYQGQSLYPQFAASTRPKMDVVQQQHHQQRSCLRDPPASGVADCTGSSNISGMSSQQVQCSVKEDKMDKKPRAKQTGLDNNKDSSQATAAATLVDDNTKNIIISKKQQATTVAAFDVTCSNDSQGTFPIITIDEEEDGDEEEKEEEGIDSGPEPSGAATSSGGASSSHDGNNTAYVDQGDTQHKNADTVSCDYQGEMNDNDLDSVLAEAVILNGGKLLSPDILRMWRETTTSSAGLSAISLPSMFDQQDLSGGKGLSPEALQLWRETTTTSFDLSKVSLPSIFEQQQQEQQQQQDEASRGSSSTDTHENKNSSRKKKSPPTVSPTSKTSSSSVGEDNLGMPMATTCQNLNNPVVRNINSTNGDCVNKDKARAAALSKEKRPSLEDMSLYTDDMGKLLSQAAQVYARGVGSASTCSKDYSI